MTSYSISMTTLTSVFEKVGSLHRVESYDGQDSARESFSARYASQRSRLVQNSSRLNDDSAREIDFNQTQSIIPFTRFRLNDEPIRDIGFNQT